ncbi:bacitracin resistance protein [Halosimplex carlsbadense 2-9-1]|uniref:Undecaprenyl-diphosphatase n=1 Tax=Halosimplex carlsbadense 2-9-1 TaxID=797114 RepID=M0CK90_9EURY|nr:undecaprenyl-diphosphate phosphatase [Halosimplex carlsbadense]ELZ23705.1 bacitracin resistance protein [Halosimplex carlsbadense 2-9-1]
MQVDETVVAVILGLVQGALEWLPVSSEGTVALVLTLFAGEAPVVATRFALFLHSGTAIAATVFYRSDIVALLRTLPDWQPRAAFDDESASLSFYVLATLVSGVVGISMYLTLAELASELAGGGFVALIGALLVGTGLIQRTAEQRGHGGRESPDAVDALLVGVMQGLALLPGVSRSGTTVSALLLRGHEGEATLRLSFLLSIPASLGAGLLVVVDEGVPAVSPEAAMIAIGVSAVVGFLTVSALVAVVRRVAFWGVCVGFGALAILGGALLVV